MDLDQAMLLVARALDHVPDEAALTAQVRAALTAAMTGGQATGVDGALALWLAQEQERSSTFYQEMLGRVIVRLPDGSVAVRRERGAHRATGAYYTRDVVVRYMLARARAYIPDAASVVDPACGAGAFLEGARRAFPGLQTQLAGFDADPLALELCRRQVPEAAVCRADALLDEIPVGYDLCLGNPPYISSGLRGAARQDEQRLRLLRERFPQTAQYKVNTYPLFIERGLELLREGGVLGYIVPDSFLSGRYFAGLRQLLLSHTLLELTLVRQDFWAYGKVGQSVILFVRKGPAPAGHRVRVKLCDKVEELDTTPAEAIPLKELTWSPLHRFRLIPDRRLRQVIQAMESVPGALPLGAFFKTYSGLIGRQGQASLLRSAHPERPGPWGRLIRSGQEIDRYQIAWAGEEVSLDRALIKSGGNLAYYRHPKLLLRQTADSLRAAYDEQGFYCLNNVHLLVPRGISPDARALLGLINSRPVGGYYQAMTMESGRLYAQVDLDLLETVPIPPLPDAACEELSRLVRARETAASSETAQLEAEVDGRVEQLYGLV